MVKRLFIVTFFVTVSIFSKSQIVDLENLNLPPDSFWNGSDGSGFFVANQIATFPNNFVDWGNGITSWSGFAYSNMTNTITQSYTNQYSTYAGQQLINSTIFGVSYNNSDWNTGEIIPNFVTFNQPIIPISIDVTNTTYTALTMKNGDSYSKKFGGETGNDPDWFKLTIKGYLADSLTGIVDFYLADYRFTNNEEDYIVKDWQNVDLSALGQIDKLSFELSSSDTGIFGMNTPAYFCFDNIVYSIEGNINDINNNDIFVYPSITSGLVNINKPVNKLIIYNIQGIPVYEQSTLRNTINLSSLPNGVYIIKIENQGKLYTYKVVKQ